MRSSLRCDLDPPTCSFWHRAWPHIWLLIFLIFSFTFLTFFFLFSKSVVKVDVLASHHILWILFHNSSWHCPLLPKWDVTDPSNSFFSDSFGLIPWPSLVGYATPLRRPALIDFHHPIQPAHLYICLSVQSRSILWWFETDQGRHPGWKWTKGMTVAESGWKWMKVNESVRNARKWVRVNEIGWNWTKVVQIGERGWKRKKWISMDESGYEMDGNGRQNGLKWLKDNESERKSMKVDENYWKF